MTVCLLMSHAAWFKMIDWCIDWLIDWWMDGLIDWLIDWLTDWLVVLHIYVRAVDKFKVIYGEIFKPAPLWNLQWPAILGAMGLGFCLSLLFFMDQNIAGAMVNSPDNRYETDLHCLFYDSFSFNAKRGLSRRRNICRSARLFRPTLHIQNKLSPTPSFFLSVCPSLKSKRPSTHVTFGYLIYWLVLVICVTFYVFKLLKLISWT